MPEIASINAGFLGVKIVVNWADRSKLVIKSSRFSSLVRNLSAGVSQG
jgi:hypothetical protein